MNRLQLGPNSRVGSFQLIDYGDPSLDLFNAYANRFLVVVPRWPGAQAASRFGLRWAQHRAERAAFRQRLAVLEQDKWIQENLNAGRADFGF